MNQHVSPPGPTLIRNQEDAFVVLPSAQVDAINCMIEIIDEPYTAMASPITICGGTSARLPGSCFL